MSHAEICPVCQGKGKILENFPSDTAIREVVCHGCNGRGWVVVDNNITYTNRCYSPKQYPHNRH
jgi:DnaJ-class molecular chaperone